MKITFVCVNYFSFRLLRPLIDSLEHSVRHEWELIVVDNSTDSDEFRALEETARMHPQCTVVRSNSNVGYLNALPLALEFGTQQDYDWLVLMNMDVLVVNFPNNGQSALYDEEVGIVAPSILSKSTGRDSNPYMPVRPSRRSMLKRRLMFRLLPIARLFVFFSSLRPKPAPGLRHEQLNNIYAGHGSCVIMSRRYIEAGGAIKQPVFLFCEEITLAEEVRRLNLKIRYEPSISLLHSEHQTTSRWRSRELLMAQREAIEYSWKLLYKSV